MAFQKINDNLYLNQALVVSCGVMQKGGKNVYTLKLNSGVDVNLTDICPNNEMAEAIYNQVKAWEGGGGGGPVGPLEDLMYDDTHTLKQVMDEKLEGPAKDLLYDDEGEETLGDVVDGKVDATRKVAGVSLEQDTENLQDYQYGTETRVIDIPAEVTTDIYDLPVSYDLSTFPMEDALAYSNIPDGAAILDPTGVYQIGLITDVPEGLAILYMRDGDTFLYMKFNNTEGWYVIDEQSQMPELVDNLPLEFEVEDLDYIKDATLMAQILGLQPTQETIEVDLTLKEKVDDFANWDYKITEKNNLVEGETYPLKAELNANDMSDLIDELSMPDTSRSKFANQMWGLGNYIIDSTQSDMHWSFFDPDTDKWNDLTIQFIDEPSTITSAYVYGYNILYYNNKTYVTADFNNNGLECNGCIYEASLDATTRVLTLTRHNISLDGGKLYARCVFELDNKLLAKVNKYDTAVYEIDLENYTATLTNYEFFYYSYSGNTGTLYRYTSSLYVNGYRFVMYSGNENFVTSYNSSEVSHVRHVQTGDQEALYDQSITLDSTYSLILDRVNPSDAYAGTHSGIMGNLFYATTDGTDRIVCGFEWYSGEKVFYKYDENINMFVPITVNLSSNAISNWYFDNLFYVNGQLYYYNYAERNKLYAQTDILNSTLNFIEILVDQSVDKTVYLKDSSADDEVSTIQCKFDKVKNQQYLLLNDTYYYYEGTSWVDSNDNPVDLSNLTIDFDWDYLYTDSIFLIQCLANSTKYEKQSLKQYLDDYLNWKYSTSTTKKFFDVPQWENLIEEGTLYSSPDKTDQVIEVHFGIYGIEKTIYITPQGADHYDNYWICNVDTSYDGENFKANTWYYYSDDNGTNTEVPTPDLTLMEQYIVDTQINAVYGYKEISLGDMLNEPLCDKFYGTVDTAGEVVEIVDGETYEFNSNMGFSPDDATILSSLTPGDYIYDTNNRSSRVFIQFSQSGDYMEFVYNDGEDIYEYYIYDTFNRQWVNEWSNNGGNVKPGIPLDGDVLPKGNDIVVNSSSDIWITVNEAAIINREIFERMLNITPTSANVKKDITLKEKIADLANWDYENKGIGIYDIPKWDLITSTIASYENFYYDNVNNIEIEFSVYNGVYNYFIYDNGNNKRYMIANQDISEGGITAKKNTWYLTSNEGATPTTTPELTLDAINANPNYIDLFNALYGERKLTLKEKIDSISGGGSGSDEPLKDQTYGEDVIMDSNSVLSPYAYAPAPVRPRLNPNLPSISSMGVSIDDGVSIYYDNEVLITYYYFRAYDPRGWQITNSGFRVVYSEGNLQYQILDNDHMVNNWAGFNNQADTPEINGAWNVNAIIPLPIGYRSETPNYNECMYISGYNEVTNQPAMWNTAYKLYYRYDDQNDEYYRITDYEAPEWGSETFYYPEYSYLDSEPQDWATIYDNGNFFDPLTTRAIIETIFCRATNVTLTLEQKINQIGNSVGYTTAIPQGPNTSGRLIVVLCTEEPEYQYDGYLYIIADDADLTPYSGTAQSSDSSNNGGNGGIIIEPGGGMLAG